MAVGERDKPDESLIMSTKRTHIPSKRNQAQDSGQESTEEDGRVQKKPTKKKRRPATTTSTRDAEKSPAVPAPPLTTPGTTIPSPETGSHNTSKQSSVIEIEDEDEPPIVSKKNFTHRLKMPLRPATLCAADHPAFQTSESLAYTFLEVQNPTHNSDGTKLLSCTMVCAFCKAVEKQKSWEWNTKGQGSTTNFLNHFKRDHGAVWSKREAEDNAVRFPNRVVAGPGGTMQQTLDSWSGIAFDAALANRLKAEWLVVRNHPFSEVEVPATRRFLVHLRPGYEKHMVKADQQKVQIENEYEKARERLRKALKEAKGRKAFAADAWTSQNNLAFLALVASFITNDWELKQVLVDFPELVGAHTGKNMAEIVMKRIRELGLENEFIALTADNASNNDTLRVALANLLNETCDFNNHYQPEKITIRCLPHAIHLVVREFLVKIKSGGAELIDEDEVEVVGEFTEQLAEGVASQDSKMKQMSRSSDEELVEQQAEGDDGVDMSAVVQKIREVSKISRSSPQRSAEFRKTITLVNAVLDNPAHKLDLLNLILDVVTRWNSTYFMLKRARTLRPAVDELCLRNDLYRKYKLSADEWEVLDIVLEFLEVFRMASEKMSSGTFPTLAASLLIYTKLMKHIDKFMAQPIVQKQGYLKEGLESARLKLKKYFDKSAGESEFYYAAAVLDHRVKHDLFNKHPELFSTAWRQEMDGKFRSALNRYGADTFPVQSTATSISRSSSTAELFEDEDLLGMRNDSDDSAETADQEYARYLAYRLKTNVGSLEFWKTHASHFPRMAAYARDVLAIPGSSVAVERALSVGRDVIGLHRYSMGAETIRMLMVFRGILMSEGADREDYMPRK